MILTYSSWHMHCGGKIHGPWSSITPSSTITHRNVSESIPKQFRFGNSSTQITKYNSQNNSARDSVILYSHLLPRPSNSETVRFGNHRAGITENNSRIIKFSLVIILCVMVMVRKQEATIAPDSQASCRKVSRTKTVVQSHPEKKVWKLRTRFQASTAPQAPSIHTSLTTIGSENASQLTLPKNYFAQ